jgi:peptidoglycan hydrolase-like protein with peptidoglycan-binding domain
VLSHPGFRRRLTHNAVAASFALLLATSAPAFAASGGVSASGGNSGSNSSAGETDSTGHVYPGDSRHMGDRILRLGMHGHDVRVLQDYLTLAGFKTSIDGNFGASTQQNLVSFERSHQMAVDSVLTFSVSQALRAAVATTLASDAPVGKAYLTPDGLAVAPADAPEAVQEVIAAANKIAFDPYIYGGGHGSFNAKGYDCSGSVSYALHGAHLLSSPEDSSQLETYGNAGPGQWITIWANGGHTYMYVAGLRFDTSAQGSTGGSRWTAQGRSNAGYVERHPTGL